MEVGRETGKMGELLSICVHTIRYIQVAAKHFWVFSSIASVSPIQKTSVRNWSDIA